MEGRRLGLVTLGAALIAAAACGDRSSLEDGETTTEPIPPADDAAADAPPLDGRAEDGPTANDAAVDAPATDATDATVRDAALDGGCATPHVLYVLTALAAPHLYRFDTTTFSFVHLGPVSCPGSPDLYSMAIDRRGVGWVTSTASDVFTLDFPTLTCARVFTHSGPPRNLQIGVAAAAPGSAQERLFAVDANDRELMTLDWSTFAPTTIGTLTPPLMLPRLTGTADAKLYAVGFTSPITEVDTSNAQVTVIKDITEFTGIGGGFAVATFDGDLFIFRGLGANVARAGRFSFASNAFVTLADLPIATQAVFAGAGAAPCASP